MGTARIANFVANTSYGQMPPEAIAVAKRCVLDGLGVALAGSKEPASKTIVAHVKELGGRPEAGVIRGGFQTSAPQSALANGVMAHALDYDDAIEGWGGHLTAVILPAVLALAQRENSSGRETLEAFVVGWEVGAKIGDVIGLTLMRQGLHAHAVVGPLAAAAAASKLLKLGEKQVRMALGIASAEAMGLRTNHGTDTKPFHAGKGAYSGVTAALLARRGFTANDSILEGNLGLFRVLTQKEWDPAKVAEGLGDPFSILSPGVSVKMYPSCGLTQRCLDAILHLIKEYRLVAEDVAEVVCETDPSVAKTLGFSCPQTGLEGKFSMQYCMTAALLDGQVGLGQFADEKVSAPKAQELIPRVRFVHPAAGAGGALDTRGRQTVIVRLRDGREYSREVLHARGEPENPMSWEELSLKFRDCARLVLPLPSVERCIELVANLDSARGVAGLMDMVTG